jgi:hypothetical protein
MIFHAKHAVILTHRAKAEAVPRTGANAVQFINEIQQGFFANACTARRVKLDQLGQIRPPLVW